MGNALFLSGSSLQPGVPLFALRPSNEGLSGLFAHGDGKAGSIRLSGDTALLVPCSRNNGMFRMPTWIPMVFTAHRSGWLVWRTSWVAAVHRRRTRPADLR